MGIYDRDYVRNRRVGGGTMRGGVSGRTVGVLGMFSVNTWIITANVAVFFLAAALSRTQVPVQVSAFSAPPVAQGTVYQESELRPVGQGLYARRYGIPRSAPVRASRAEADRSLALANRTGNPVWITETFTDGSVAIAPMRVIGSDLYRTMDPLHAYGHFSTALGFFRVEVWRLISFQFLHASFAHLFFNMLGLFIFGGLVEQQLGRKRYAAFYLVCGVFGGISYLALNVLGAGLGLRFLPGVLINDIHTPLVGASAGVFGVIMACARIAPNAVVQLIFPPIPLRMKWLAYGYVALAVFNLLRAGQNAGGDAAHVGGAIAGWFFIRNAHLLRDFFDIFGDSRKGPRRARPVGPSQRDIDRVLENVRKKGMDSLSEKEKRMLARASEAERRRG